jgi:hypothetical protein
MGGQRLSTVLGLKEREDRREIGSFMGHPKSCCYKLVLMMEIS